MSLVPFSMRKPALLAAALTALWVSAAPATAQVDRPPAERSQAVEGADQRTGDDEFSRQFSELKKTFADLSKKIDDGAQSMGRLKDAESARKEIEELRAHVATLLGAVADNGTVFELGNKALKRATTSSRRSSRRPVTSRKTAST